MPEELEIEVSQLIDYPPRLSIFLQHAQSSSAYSIPELQVMGLDIECSLPITSEEHHF